MSALLPRGGEAVIRSVKADLAEITRLECEINAKLCRAGISEQFVLLGSGALLHRLETLEFEHRIALSKRTRTGTVRRLR